MKVKGHSRSKSHFISMKVIWRSRVILVVTSKVNNNLTYFGDLLTSLAVIIWPLKRILKHSPAVGQTFMGRHRHHMLGRIQDFQKEGEWGVWVIFLNFFWVLSPKGSGGRSPGPVPSLVNSFIRRAQHTGHCISQHFLGKLFSFGYVSRSASIRTAGERQYKEASSCNKYDKL
jgi:hypothetical protein